MPYERLMRTKTALVEWHDVRLLDAATGWGERYRPVSPRLLIPRTALIEVELAGRRHTCDRLGGVWLTPSTAYRVRQPWVNQRSIVLAFNDIDSPERATTAHLPVRAPMVLATWAAELAAGQLDTLAFEESAIALMHKVASTDAAHAPTFHRAVERAREYLNAELHRNDSLAQIASNANCSPFHLARAFKARTGMGLHAYRTHLRLAVAVDRIANGEQHFSTLAVDLGFANHSHFSSVFRRIYGTSPAKVRTDLTAHTRP